MKEWACAARVLYIAFENLILKMRVELEKK